MTQLGTRRLWLLGPARVEQIQQAHSETQENVAGTVPRFRSRRTVGLLGYLAAAGRPVAREFLAGLFWPDEAYARGRSNLSRELHNLAQILPDCWELDRQAVAFIPSANTIVDLYQLQYLAAEERWAEAAELVGGEFLEGVTLDDNPEFENWLLGERERWRAGAETVLSRVIEGHTRRGRYADALRDAQRLLQLAPWNEEAHRQVMRLLAWTGQRGAALRQFETCERALSEELNIRPAAETVALYQQIQAGKLDLPPQLPAFLTEEKARRAFERPLFVGREGELARLDAFLDGALAGQGRVVFITGDPGRGKTALLEAFARRAMTAHRDLLVAMGDCNAYSGLGDPYLPFRDVMGMLTGDVEARWDAGAITRDHAQRLWAAFPLVIQALVDLGPSLIGTILSDPALLPRATAVAPEGAGWLPELRALSAKGRAGHSGLEQSAIFHQFSNVLRTLAETHPLLLMLDDVQWADSASIGLLFHLGRRLEGSCILIACAYRPEEVALEREGKRHPLEKVLAEFKRSFGDVWVDLKRADEREGRSFVDGFLDTEPNRLGEEFRTALFEHAGGHPLFTVEVLRAMQERGDLVRDADGRWVAGPALDWDRLPARVEAVIAERIGRLDEDLRDVLAVASVEGERFTAQVVAQVQSIPEREMLRLLSRELAARHRLVREVEELQIDGRFLSRYQFAHTLFQEYLYGALSAGERRLLHGEIAAALEELYGDQTAEIVAQLAHHYDAAGRAEKAVEYSLRTGDQALLVYANEEAIAYFNWVLKLLDGSPLSESRKDWRVEALKGLGQVYYGMGKLTEAEECFQEAISLGREIGLAPRVLVRLYHWLAEVLWWLDRYDDQIRVGEEGLALLGDDTESIEGALMNDAIAAAHLNKRNVEEWREFTYRTAQFIQRLPYVEELRPAYCHIHLAYSWHKEVEEPMKWLQALERIATQHHDLRALGEVHFYAASFFLLWTGDLHGAIQRYGQALEWFARIGDAKYESICWQDMGSAFLALGDLQEAELCVSKGLETNVGHKVNYHRLKAGGLESD